MAAELLSNPASKTETVELTNGSCLCRSITYTITGSPSTTVLCHCASCKKSSGSSFMANGFYERSQFKITSSTDTLKTYNDHSPDAGGFVERNFCKGCGSPVYIPNPKYPSALIVASGTMDLDALKEWKPQAEFFCRRRGPWIGSAGAAEGQKFNAMT